MSDHVPYDREEQDDKTLLRFDFYVGESLYDDTEEPVTVFLDEHCAERFYDGDRNIWAGVLGYVQSEAA